MERSPLTRYCRECFLCVLYTVRLYSRVSRGSSGGCLQCEERATEHRQVSASPQICTSCRASFIHGGLGHCHQTAQDRRQVAAAMSQ